MVTLQRFGFGWYSQQQENVCSDDISLKKMYHMNQQIFSFPTQFCADIIRNVYLYGDSICYPLIVGKGIVVFFVQAVFFSLTRF